MNSEHTAIQSGKSPFSRVHLNAYGISSILIAFSIIILFVFLGDAIMSYVVPDFVQSNLNNSGTLMGLILSTSSLVGFFSDFLFGKWFKKKKFGFFLKWTFAFAIAFPLILIFFPSTAFFFIISMTSWGIYCELLGFANDQFIVTNTERSSHAISWGILYIFKSLSYTLAPMIAALLLDKGDNVPFIIAIVFYCIGLVGFTLLQFARKNHHHNEAHKIEKIEKVPFKKELNIWIALTKKLWMILLLIFVLTLIDATFWTTGTVLSQQIHVNGLPDGMLLVFYEIPSLFMGIITGKLAKPLGKKRAALIAGFIGAIFLIIAGVSQNNYILLLLLVFLSSVATSIAWPEIKGALADYEERLGHNRNDLIGLESAAINLAYILGPIIAGFLSDHVGSQQTFTVIGIFVVIVIIIVYKFTPRKIKLPQHELEIVNAFEAEIQQVEVAVIKDI